MRNQIKRIFYISLIWVAAFINAVPAGNDILSNIKIKWRPTKLVVSTEYDTTNVSKFMGKAISVMEFGDIRLGLANKQNIGTSPYSPFPITTAEDVPHWCSARFSQILATKGLSVVKNNAAIQIEGEVKKFFVTEQGGYTAEIEIMCTVKDSIGTTLWRDLARGKSEDKGKSLDKKLYFRTLSNAMVLAVKDFLINVKLERPEMQE